MNMAEHTRSYPKLHCTESKTWNNLFFFCPDYAKNPIQDIEEIISRKKDKEKCLNKKGKMWYLVPNKWYNEGFLK